MSKLEEYFEKFSNMDFPIYQLKDEYITRLYDNLKKTKADRPRSNCALELVMSFHPSIWSCNVHGHVSPLEAWYTPELLYKCIENRLQYKGEQLTPKDIVHGFSANFHDIRDKSAHVAKNPCIIQKNVVPLYRD